ncbi:hypothetical protein GALL_553140 [mine drainage metagenome]|uniref:Uncharacterized protein n=1 Tax=mine drainage metagenome TaxID=410659 RepID=A0A1J5NWL0_9ZZZZ
MLGSIYNSVIVAVVGVGEYGVIIALLAAKKFVMSLSATVVDCDVRSDSVRAISVTLRSTATPEENSTVPKNITSMIGTITANSVAAIPRRSSIRSRTERRIRGRIIDSVFIGLSISKWMSEP